MQRHISLLALTLVAVGLLASTTAAIASAAELPEFTVESKSTGTIGKTTLSFGTTKLSCEKGSSTSTPTSKNLGTDTITMTACKLGGEECKSLGGKAGTIEVSGTGSEYHIVRAVGGGSALIWFLIPSTHIECKFAATLYTLKGNVLGEVEPINTKTTKFTVKIEAPGGKQTITKFTNDEGKEVVAKFEASVNGGEFKAASDEAEKTEFTFERETEITHTS